MGYDDIQIAKQSALAGRTPEEEKRNRAAHAEQEARLVEQARREEYKKKIAQPRVALVSRSGFRHRDAERLLGKFLKKTRGRDHPPRSTDP